MADTGVENLRGESSHVKYEEGRAPAERHLRAGGKGAV